MILKTKNTIFLFVVLSVISIISYAQQIPDMPGMENEMEEEEESKTNEKDIDPMIGIWYLNGYGAFQDSTDLDTLQDFFHLYHPAFKEAVTLSYVGNYGTPYLDNDFFARHSNLNYLFLRSREAYMLTPQTIKFYNTRTPYTQLDFSQSENSGDKSETRFNVLHSQNANPYLNFTFNFNSGKSEGQYNNQQSKNNLVSLYSSYNKNYLNIYSGFVSNSIKNNENGGLTNDSLIFISDDSKLLNTNLNESKSHFNSTYFFVNGEYRFGTLTEYEPDTTQGEAEYFESDFDPILGVMYSFQYERHKQEFISEPGDSSFWENRYYGDEYNNDSIRFNKITNVFQLKQYENPKRKASFGKRAFLGQEFTSISTPGLEEGIESRKNNTYNNIFTGAGIYRQTGKFWTWNFEGKLYLLGRRAGQTELKGTISKPFAFLKDTLSFIRANGAILNEVADPLQEEFYSNYFRWNQDFKMMQSMNASGSFVSPERQLELTANYSIINNFIYNNSQGIPSQTDKELLILSAYLNKDFNYKGIHFRTRVLWQHASNEDFIHLPKLSTFVSAYYKFIVSKVLFAQIGVDTRYTTKYYADAYQPATGLFHLQSEKKYGNFPYIDGYASVRLKRTRVFFKMMNLGMQFLNGEYMTTPSYPMVRTTYRLGFSWVFYD